MGADVGTMSVSLYDGSAPSPAAASTPTPPRDPPPAQEPAATTAVEIEPLAPTDVEPQFIDVSLLQPDPDARLPVDDPVALSVAAAASAAAGSACDLTQWIQKALQADPQVQQALARIPRPARSIANAIMLWDGAWVATRATAADDTAAIRLAVISGVAAAPEACQNQATRGPELFTLNDAMGTTVVVVGSGNWKWADLLKVDPQPQNARVALATGPTAKP